MHSAHEYPVIQWTKGDETFSARWQSERNLAVPGKVMLADDTLTADMAYRLACEGNVFLWQSDFQNARQLMQALVRRVDKNAEHKKSKAAKSGKADVEYPQKFHLYRQAQAQRARILGSILIPFNADYSIPLRRAPDVLAACTEAWGEPPVDGPMIVTSLREMMGVVGAHEWRKKGVDVPALGDPPSNRIHPYYGVFSPVRGEYVDLVLKAPLPKACEVNGSAVDVGTGTGVLAAVLAQRWLSNIVATDNGILHKMRQFAPGKTLIEAPTAGNSATCKSCAHCPWMAMNGLKNLRDVLKTGFDTGLGEVHVDTALGKQAYRCIDRMLDFAKTHGISGPRGQGRLEQAHKGVGPA